MPGNRADRLTLRVPAQSGAIVIKDLNLRVCEEL
jgi:hypothetical protein